MTEIQKYNYSRYDVSVKCSEEGKFYAYTSFLSTFNPNDSFKGGYNTIEECKKDIEAQIDDFINTFPKNYEELAKKIGDTLVWTGYEDCHADPQIIQNLVENFIMINKL